MSDVKDTERLGEVSCGACGGVGSFASKVDSFNPSGKRSRCGVCGGSGRASPADGKAERGEGECPGCESAKSRQSFESTGDPGRLRCLVCGTVHHVPVAAGQQSRLDERERAVLEGRISRLREGVRQLGGGSVTREKWADDILQNDLDSAAKSDALGEGRKA